VEPHFGTLNEFNSGMHHGLMAKLDNVGVRPVLQSLNVTMTASSAMTMKGLVISSSQRYNEKIAAFNRATRPGGKWHAAKNFAGRR
jgi:hypothetical protein